MENKTDFNQQNRGKMTHYISKISYCIPTNEHFRKIIQVFKCVVKVVYMYMYSIKKNTIRCD